ncbi:MAG: HD domain-containing protein [Clostridia bacterium]|nr:HD domain-containing protein [Clostridia bacterium]
MKLNSADAIIVNNVNNAVKDIFANDYSGHDYLHTLRVLKNAHELQAVEGGDLFLISLSALLHDVDDYKLFPGNSIEKSNAHKILRENSVEEYKVYKIIEIIDSVSYSKCKAPQTIEAKIVQDADRLDPLGAIGIARCFAFGGNHNRPIYTENDLDGKNISGSNSSFSHFYQKLLKLNDLMQTEEGKKRAVTRTEFILSYLNQLMSEII